MWLESRLPRQMSHKLPRPLLQGKEKIMKNIHRLSRQPDAHHRLLYRFLHGGQNHQPPQADLCGSEASTSPDRLSGIFNGRREIRLCIFLV